VKTTIITLNWVLTLGTATFFYFVLRLRLWRQYYSRDLLCSSPRCIDRGDKMTAFMFACVFAAVWFVSLPIYLVQRYRIMTRNRAVAGRYADEMERRYYAAHPDDTVYVWEPDERR